MTEIKDVDREAAEKLAASLFDGIRDPDAIKSLWCASFAAHREAAEKAERDRICAWLLTYPPVIGLDEMAAWNTAAHIERGEHLK